MRKVSILAAVLVTLSACGEVSQAAEDSMKKELAATVARQCNETIANSEAASMAPANTIDAVCQCTATELVEKNNLTDLANIGMDDIQPVAMKCAEQVGMKVTTTPPAE